MILTRDFYFRPVQSVARDLLGKRLTHLISGQRVGGIIVEAEAYDGEQDLACHARVGKTERNKVMYSQGGHAYVYFTYGMHWMLNCVTGETGYPSAVLIRAIAPTDGLEFISAQRPNVQEKQLCNGPAKLTKALAITGELNGSDLCDPDGALFIEQGEAISDNNIRITPRIGIQTTPEPWLSKPWRFVATLS
ncbi:MAG: DNA-3-methyladenine glycosylase [Anaerolineaceae bacterium]|nr:DNA-3-methyladenine glycosylase [Anaerolineaceae bacterium]